MKKIKDQGPEQLDIDKFKIAYQKNLATSLKQNSFWITYLQEQSQNGDDLLTILHTDDFLKGITKASLKDAAKLFFSNENVISFELLPESENKSSSQTKDH